MAHLTLFETLEEYNDYVSGETFVYPNISYCEEDGKVYYKQVFTKSMSAVFTIGENDDLTIKIANATKGIVAEKVDGVFIEKPVKEYTFDERGQHTVEYQFEDRTTVPNNVFKELSALTSVNLSGITELGDGNLYRCQNMQSIGTSTLNMNIGDGSLNGSVVTDITSLTINGNIGNNSVSFPQQANTITSVVINGDVGSGNFNGFSKLTGATISGNMGSSNFSGCGLIELNVGGNVGSSNCGGISTLTGITIGGSIDNSNFGGSESFIDVSIGGNVGNGNFSYSTHNFRSVVIGTEGVANTGNIGSGNYFYGNSDFTANFVIRGNITGGGNNFLSGSSITIDGDITGAGNFFYCTDVLVKGNISGYNNLTATTSGNGIITVQGDVTTGSSFYCNHLYVNGDAHAVGGSMSAATIGGDLYGDTTSPTSHNWSFGGTTGLTAVTVSGTVHDYCFGGCTNLTSVNISSGIGTQVFIGGRLPQNLVINGDVGDGSIIGNQGVTNITINGGLGNGSINDNSSIESVTIDGNVGSGSLNLTGSTGQAHLTAVTLTDNCTAINSTLSGLTQLTVMATTPPTLGSEVVLTNSQIYVPAAVVDTYKEATGWSDYASNIQAIVTS